MTFVFCFVFYHFAKICCLKKKNVATATRYCSVNNLCTSLHVGHDIAGRISYPQFMFCNIKYSFLGQNLLTMSSSLLFPPYYLSYWIEFINYYNCQMFLFKAFPCERLRCTKHESTAEKIFGGR